MSDRSDVSDGSDPTQMKRIGRFTARPTAAGASSFAMAMEDGMEANPHFSPHCGPRESETCGRCHSERNAVERRISRRCSAANSL